jgi:hypothetical protein
MCVINVRIVNVKGYLLNKTIKCEFCLVVCNSYLCFLHHREKVCSKIDKCLTCGAFNIFSHYCKGKWCFVENK